MTINCRGKLIDFKIPKVMGILNITPDSFFERSRYDTLDKVLSQTEKMLEEGAAFIDIGGHSTRPNASPVSEEEELRRVIPAIEEIIRRFPDALISIDTFRAKVARESVFAGAVMINDVMGGNLDEEMFETTAGLNVPYVLMHSRGTPENMNQLTNYDDLVMDILDDLQQKVYQLRQLGQKDIILDLGFGFAKTTDQNFHLLNRLEAFNIMGLPMLVGVSRKSMIWRKLEISHMDALNGTTVMNTISLMKGANILRVHEVREAIEAVKLVEWTKSL
ncbi:dihydropteroate synthase [Pseudarcicella hirudinis]|uniref:dihydropteroate synthase n=1 Tax=Pseudarcicella hirudinis TaxID=1079859 RepID=A0A1I5YF98_9BACT|nr:dihydropteroate synthase [Pseudarcicella hirudinis]SFQ42780.1 dihydropteroate synthase [Pseudarcicella hirudinis]